MEEDDNEDQDGKEDKEGNEDEDNGEDEDEFAQGQQITPATSYDESLEHQFREAPNGKNLGPVWDNSGGRFMPYKKDYVTDRVRRRSMIDDMLDMMSREKLAKYIMQKRWANNDDDSDKDDEEDKEEEDKAEEDSDDEDGNAERFDILMTWGTVYPDKVIGRFISQSGFLDILDDGGPKMEGLKLREAMKQLNCKLLTCSTTYWNKRITNCIVEDYHYQRRQLL